MQAHKTTAGWPDNMPVAQLRIARPTDKLKEVKHFYCTGLGLPEISSFQGHAGYDGVMLGLPDRPYHLEFTQHEEGSPCAAPSKDNLMVLYIPSAAALHGAIKRLTDLGHEPVSPENPYWEGKSTTFEDPDGWRVVLFEGQGI